MDYYDVVFPLNLGPLTYGCKKELSHTLKPGMLVSAQLKNRNTKGIIMGKAISVPGKAVKVIQSVYGDKPVLSENMITLMKWMSEYYLSVQGLVLKDMLPREMLVTVRKKAARPETPRPCPAELSDIDQHELSEIHKSLHRRQYKTFLLHAPSSLYEYSFLIRALSEAKNAIVLIPELANIQFVYQLFQKYMGERVCLLHGDLSRGKRHEVLKKIRSGDADIVLGTRSAVFAPLQRVDILAVIHEQSASYKQEKSPCYNARDVAVMRGLIEKATVVLTSVCPSVESFHNARIGKYDLLRPDAKVQKPRIRILDMRFEKLLKPYLSKKIVNTSKKYVDDRQRVLFIMNRRGYATLLLCKECGFIEECTLCHIPLVFHKHEKIIRCHYCGYSSVPPQQCRKCGNYQLEMLGSGTQRVQEDIEELLGITTLRFDSDKTYKKSLRGNVFGTPLGDEARVIIGTKYMTGKLSHASGYIMGAFLNPDLSLHVPDFRSAERMFQEIMAVADKILSGGEIFIQTKMPQESLYKAVKNYDYSLFYNEELRKRRALQYPPFTRLLLIRFLAERDISEDIREKLSVVDDGVQVLGPSCSLHPRGKYEMKLLLKSPVRGSLHTAAQLVQEAFQRRRDITMRFDIDPIKI